MKRFWIYVAIVVLPLGWVGWRNYKNAQPISEEERAQAIYASNAQQVASAAAKAAAAESGNEEMAKLAILTMLRDPDSAHFRGITTRGGVVCGMVNSKNGLGGYAGFERFSYNPTTSMAAMQEKVDPACR